MTSSSRLTWWVASSFAAGCIIIDPSGGKPEAPPKVYCVKDKASGACRCSTDDPGLGNDGEYVANCDSLPADTQCCFAVDGDGLTKYCDCERALCARDTDTNQCTCKYFGELIVGRMRDTEEVVAACPATGCCKNAETCYCGSACFSDPEAPSCATSSIPARRTCAGSLTWGASCAGLKWKK